MNKLWYVHTMEYYAGVKKSEEKLYELIWSDFQDKLLSEETQSAREKLRV